MVKLSARLCVTGLTMLRSSDVRNFGESWSRQGTNHDDFKTLDSPKKSSSGNIILRGWNSQWHLIREELWRDLRCASCSRPAQTLPLLSLKKQVQFLDGGRITRIGTTGLVIIIIPSILGVHLLCPKHGAKCFMSIQSLLWEYGSHSTNIW